MTAGGQVVEGRIQTGAPMGSALQRSIHRSGESVPRPPWQLDMDAYDQTQYLLHRTADTVDSRDPFTRDHSVRVAEWTQKILSHLRTAWREAPLIVAAARVHDIGKISLPIEVIHKHDQLTEDEFRLIKLHPGIGADILRTYPTFAPSAEIVRAHHERWDGAGYPDGLAGAAIPLGARIIAVADSFDAMTSDRPYRARMSWLRAAAILGAGAGTQWDPQVVDAMLAVLEAEGSLSPGRREVPAVQVAASPV